MESVQQLHFSSYVFRCLDLGRYEAIYPTLSVSGKMKSHRAINYSIQWVEHVQEKIARQPKNLRTTKISLGSVQFCILLCITILFKSNQYFLAMFFDSFCKFRQFLWCHFINLFSFAQAQVPRIQERPSYIFAVSLKKLAGCVRSGMMHPRQFPHS